MKNSKFFKLNTFDFIKGLIVAVLTASLTAILQMLTIVPPNINWKQVAIISITSAISYLIKQLATDEDGAIPILNNVLVRGIGTGTTGTVKPTKPKLD